MRPLRSWFNAMPHLWKQYWQEAVAWACIWSAIGAVLGLLTYNALVTWK